MSQNSSDGKNIIFEDFEGDDNSKSIVRTVKFAHEFTVGGTGLIIDLAALVTPTDMAANGFLQPSETTLLALNIFKNRNDFELNRSGVASVMDDFLSYIVIDAKTIKLLVTVDPGDVFIGRIKSKQSVNIAEGRPLAASSLLLEGTTDFVVGDPMDLNRFAGVQLDAFTVHRAKQVSPGVFDPPVLQLKKLDNAPGADGNYHIIDGGAGFGNTLKFEDAGGVDGDLIIVHGPAVIERQTESLQSQMEAVAGGVNELIEFVNNNLAPEIPLTPSAPSYIDLRTFGSDVIALKSLYDSSLKLSEFTKTKYQVKTASGLQTIGVKSTFNNLVIGRTYKTSGMAFVDGNGTIANHNHSYEIKNGAVKLNFPILGWTQANTPDPRLGSAWIIIFVATSTTLDFEVVGIERLDSGTMSWTLEELPNHEVTTDFT